MRGAKVFFIVLCCTLCSRALCAYTLHVGNKTFTLSQTKYTIPSLAFGTPDNGVWYLSLTRTHLNNTLNIYADGFPYSACEPFVDTENYTYDAMGHLIGANENVWIEFVGQRGIDTNFTPNQDTRVRAVVRVSDDRKWLFGTREGQATNAYGAFCGYTGPNTNIWNDYANTRKFIGPALCSEYGKFILDKNKNATTLTLESGQVYTQSHTYTKFSAKTTMGIGFVKSVTASSGGGTGTAKFYSVKIWDNGTLVRDFVPVPACMRIGNFTVPYAGMFDIVEQKFYGTATSATAAGLALIPSTEYTWGHD